MLPVQVAPAGSDARGSSIFARRPGMEDDNDDCNDFRSSVVNNMDADKKFVARAGSIMSAIQGGNRSTSSSNISRGVGSLGLIEPEAENKSQPGADSAEVKTPKADETLTTLTLPPDIFDLAQQEIFNLLQKDSFKRFKSSSEYTKKVRDALLRKEQRKSESSLVSLKNSVVNGIRSSWAAAKSKSMSKLDMAKLASIGHANHE